MRLTVFWARMAEQFGPAQVDAIARDQVMRQLGGRTVVEALDAGWSAREVWDGVCDAYEVPATRR